MSLSGPAAVNDRLQEPGGVKFGDFRRRPVSPGGAYVFVKCQLILVPALLVDLGVFLDEVVYKIRHRQDLLRLCLLFLFPRPGRLGLDLHGVETVLAQLVRVTVLLARVRQGDVRIDPEF